MGARKRVSLFSVSQILAFRVQGIILVESRNETLSIAEGRSRGWDCASVVGHVEVDTNSGEERA